MAMLPWMQPARQNLYQLVIRQLRDDGLHSAAQLVAENTRNHPWPEIPPNRLAELVDKGVSYENQQMREKEGTGGGGPSVKEEPKVVQLDLEFDSSSRVCPTYSTKFTTSHRGPVLAAKFSPDGKLLATSSTDQSVRILEVDKMHTHPLTKQDIDDFSQKQPLMKNLFDHTADINDLDFHPRLPILGSCSSDCTIRFFDHSKPSAKRAFKIITDGCPLTSMAFHPCGDYVLAGSEHPVIRLFDITTLQCFASAWGDHQHTAGINQVRFSSDGRMFASASKDGSLKIWDSVSNRAAHTIPSAHADNEVCSAVFSKNGKYVLTSGKDATVKLWDLAMLKAVRMYLGTAVAHQKTSACFTSNEDFVLSADEAGNAVVLWDTRTGDLVQRLTGHMMTVRCVTSSPVDNFFVSAADDRTARFWTADSGMSVVY